MDFIDLILQWGLVLIFAAVLVEQLGLPLPAVPLLLCAGALTGSGQMSAAAILFTAVAACLLADHAWFFLGRRFGRHLLALLCRMSLSPDVCVSTTDRLIGRHGAVIFIVAKFLPGVSAVSVPTAAAAGLPYRQFLLYDGLGSLLWSGFYLTLGMVFSSEIQQLLEFAQQVGGSMLIVLAGLLFAYLSWRFLYRWRLRQLYRLTRIDADELIALFAAEPELLLVDARSLAARGAPFVALPRALDGSDAVIAELLQAEDRQRTVVTFCTCPSEASAAVLAKRLRDAGYRQVRVLTGGDQAIVALNLAFGAPLAVAA